MDCHVVRSIRHGCGEVRDIFLGYAGTNGELEEIAGPELDARVTAELIDECARMLEIKLHSFLGGDGERVSKHIDTFDQGEVSGGNPE